MSQPFIRDNIGDLDDEIFDTAASYFTVPLPPKPAMLAEIQQYLTRINGIPPSAELVDSFYFAVKETIVDYIKARRGELEDMLAAHQTDDIARELN